VELLVFQEAQLLDVAGPLQVFASANDLAVSAGRRPPYSLQVVSLDPGVVVTSSGVGLCAHRPASDGDGLDTVVVPGGRGIPPAARDPAVLDWLTTRAARARRTASVCTGAFVLAAAGLLDGRRAVTHWAFCAELARTFPRVSVEAEPIFIQDGPIWTSAGVSAGVDLALALVEADLGRAAALALARYLVVFLKRPGGQAQFSTALELQSPEDPFDALHGRVLDHLTQDLSLPRLARRSGMSDRNFSRRYVAATGVTPARAIERLRVEAARRLLSEGAASIKNVASRCGFGSEETMRRSFVRLLQTTPAEYRARFGRSAARAPRVRSRGEPGA